jgi:hypothetical protein
MFPPIFNSSELRMTKSDHFKALGMSAAWRLREWLGHYFVRPVVFMLIHINVSVTGAAKL